LAKPTTTRSRTLPGDSARRWAWLGTPRGALVVVPLLCAFAVALAYAPGMRAIDLALLDAKFAALARIAPLPAPDDIAIVGLDEATLAATPEPIALSHRTLGRALTALAQAGPREVGLDIILPDRSFDTFAAGADQSLVVGLLTLRRVAPVVLGVTTRADGSARPVHAPLIAAAGLAGFAELPQDDDGRIRRYDDRLGANGEAVPTLVGEMARALGVQAERGLIQYALGQGFDYVPLVQVVRWMDEGRKDELARAFHGRSVLVGAILPYEDRQRQPVPLARWEDSRDAPGVLVHAQALRSVLAQAMVRNVPWPLELLALALATALWFIPSWPWRAAALAAVCAGAFGGGMGLLRAGVEWPLGSVLRVAIGAAVLRTGFDGWQVRQDRARLRKLFGGYVSPAVLRSIFDGTLDAEDQRTRRTLAFLFADIRGFTRLSAATPPEEVLTLLNRYFTAMTPIVHAHGGTIDGFRGDGLMAIFGAPNALARPASAAIAAARDMFDALATLNRELVADQRQPLAIGISLALGEAVVGHVGAPDRYNYTALGDAANVASRLQELTKTSGFALVATQETVAAASGAAALGWTPLGEIAVRDHRSVQALGCRPDA
jgi:class 3 adenylate cyclase/CHASE2 domain-containing sensor protein